ncbi:MAG: chaperone NapD [Pseudomonadota bacterium]
MNISSVIVIPHPDHVEAVRERLCEIEGVELHASSPEGKMIVTVEAPDDRATTGTYEFISQLDGVLSASMVYHQKESDPETEISVEA